MSTNPDYAKKDKAELANLRANAERVLADPKRSKMHAAARAMLESLPPPAPPTRGGSTAAATASNDAIDRLATLAKELAQVFDLSPPPETSQPHKFTGSDGKPKVGGRQRNKTVAVDRYLSHRRGDAVATLGWLRRMDEEAGTGGGWYVDVTDAETIPTVMPAEEFDAARDTFLARLDEIGTPRKA